MLENVVELYRYRALLWSLIVRDLMTRYRGSVLGFLWTFLNPLILMVVYSLVFSVYMRNPMQNYTYFLFVGLLPWMCFSTCISAGTQAISERRDLINKVKFPPQVLPMVTIGSAFCNYLLSLPLMLLLAFATGAGMTWHALLFPLVAAVQFLLTTGVVYITTSVNVVFRDLQHIIVNLLQFMFFLTPILYSAEQVPVAYRDFLLLNPVAVLMSAYQDIFYYHRLPQFAHLGIVAALAFAVFFVGSWFMAARREDFAEAA